MNYGWWVKGGVPSAMLVALSGCGGWVDVSTEQQAGGGSSSGGAGGRAGAPTERDPRYDFFVMPGIVAEGEDPKTLDFVTRAVSENGALVFGTAAQTLQPIPGFEDLAPSAAHSNTYVQPSRYYYWTPESGTQPWERDWEPDCVSGDGSAAFIHIRTGPENSAAGLERWTKEGGFETVVDAPSQPGLGTHYCSYDGARAAGYVGTVGTPTSLMRAWVSDQGRKEPFNVIDSADGAPDSAFGFVGDRGAVSIATSYGSPNNLYWAEGDEALALLPQPALTCSARPASRDGRVIISACPEDEGTHLYRWTPETRRFDSFWNLPKDDLSSVSYSADGTTIVTVSGNRLSHFNGDAVALDAAPDHIEVMALSENGDAVYLQQAGSIHKALRWTRGGGFQDLGGLNGLPCTDITFADINGARVADGMVVGSSSSVDDSGVQSCGWKKSRAVLWDAQGPRDIATELERAGVDLEGLSLKRADYVWSGPRVRVMGIGQLPSGVVRSFVAELPPRD
jgi:hypothetical protein